MLNDRRCSVGNAAAVTRVESWRCGAGQGRGRAAYAGRHCSLVCSKAPAEAARDKAAAIPCTWSVRLNGIHYAHRQLTYKGEPMRDTTTDLLSRIETLEARLKALEATQSPAADAATTPAPTEHIAAEPSSRRDLLRYGAVALGAAAAAGMAASPVEAADGGPVLIGG